MSENQESSSATNNYGFNDDGPKNTGPGQPPVVKRIPLMSIVLTLSYRVVEVEEATAVPAVGGTLPILNAEPGLVLGDDKGDLGAKIDMKKKGK